MSESVDRGALIVCVMPYRPEWLCLCMWSGGCWFAHLLLVHLRTKQSYVDVARVVGWCQCFVVAQLA